MKSIFNQRIMKMLAIFCAVAIVSSGISITAFAEEKNLYTYSFENFAEATKLSAGAIVLENEIGDIKVYGNPSTASDTINPSYSMYYTNSGKGNLISEGGIWWNGAYSNNTRYIEFTPKETGKITLRMRNTWNKPDGTGTASKLACGTVLNMALETSESMVSPEYVTATFELEKDTTYYFWPASSGVNISSIQYNIGTDEPVITPEPQQTTEPQEGVYMYSFEDIANDTPLTEDGFTLTQEGGTFTVYGTAPTGADYINPVDSALSSGHAECNGGVWWNGKRNGNTRYFEFTPAADGKLTITLCGAYSNAILAHGTTLGTKSGSTQSLSKSYTTYTVKLVGGTTYYFWPENTGVTINSLEYDTRNIPAPTNEPIATVEPVVKQPSPTPEVTKSPDLQPISEVDTTLETNDRLTLKVDDERFFYNGVQIRIDKVTDAYNYTSEDLRNLFKQAKEDGFTVVNAQIRWTDIQPEQKISAVESTYIKGGSNSSTNYSDGTSMISSYSENEDNQSMSYIKYDLSEVGGNFIDGTKLRIYVNSVSGANNLRLYGILDDIWDASNLTWDNAPNHDGYTLIGEDIYDLGITPEYDPVNKKQYYDFDVTDFINRYCMEDKKASFILRTDRATQTSVTIDGVNGTTYVPQLIIAKDDGYDWTWLDQAIGFAEEFGLKFEVLWFGTDTVSISMDGRVPYYVHRNYSKSIDSNGSPFFKKNTDPVYGVYYYLMCKNDLALREKESEVVTAMMNHIAEYNEQNGDKKTVIGCQVANEPAVGRLHGAYIDSHCMCETCIEKKGDMSIQDFRDLTMWEYCNNIATAVKESNYSVWTRVNNFDSTDASGVAYNEKMRETQGTNIDFIGHDTYHFSIENLYKLGHTTITTPKSVTVNYAEGKNLPMIMENSGDVSNAASLTLASLAGGSFYNVYDLCSTDKHGLYDNGADNTLIPHGDYVEEVRNTNKMLNKIAYHLASKKADGAGGETLKFFNELSEGTKTVSKNIRMINTTYTTDNSGVGIAVEESDRSIVLESTTASEFKFDGINRYIVQSVESGYYDENNAWVTLSGKEYQENDDDITINMDAYECVRVTVANAIEEGAQRRYEIEQLAYTTQNASAAVINETAYSGGAWSNVTYSELDGFVEYIFDVEKEGLYNIALGTKEKNNRVTAQIYIDGEVFGEPLVMNASSDMAKTYNLGSVALTEGEHTIRFTATDISRGNYGGYDYFEITKILETQYDNEYDLKMSVDNANKLGVNAVYHGKEVSPEHKLVIASYNADKTLNDVKFYAITGTGDVDLGEDGYILDENKDIKIFVWDSLDGMKPLSNVYLNEDIGVLE